MWEVFVNDHWEILEELLQERQEELQRVVLAAETQDVEDNDSSGISAIV